MKKYYVARTRQGRWCFGKTPTWTFPETLPLATEKSLWAA